METVVVKNTSECKALRYDYEHTQSERRRLAGWPRSVLVGSTISLGAFPVFFLLSSTVSYCAIKIPISQKSNSILSYLLPVLTSYDLLFSALVKFRKGCAPDLSSPSHFVDAD